MSGPAISISHSCRRRVGACPCLCSSSCVPCQLRFPRDFFLPPLRPDLRFGGGAPPWPPKGSGGIWVTCAPPFVTCRDGPSGGSLRGLRVLPCQPRFLDFCLRPLRPAWPGIEAPLTWPARGAAITCASLCVTCRRVAPGAPQR